MKVNELKSFIDNNRTTIALRILNRKYIPQAIKGVEIPKSNGKTRLLGVPTVVDRWLQQAVSQQLATRFELEFEEESHGFRPKRNAQKAVQQSLKHINDGYQDIVDIAHEPCCITVLSVIKCSTALIRAIYLVGSSNKSLTTFTAFFFQVGLR